MQDLNILIVGAGVAGLTCAGLLSKNGVNYQIIEKEPEQNFNKSGYMLGLLPLGGRVLNALDARELYFEHSIQMEHYEIHHADGTLIKDYPLDFINEKYGSYRGISRTDLIDILLKQIRESIRFDTTIQKLSQLSDGVDVVFSDDNTGNFDVVIVADGLHSKTRDLVLSPNEFSYYDTGWGGWVAWLNEKPNSVYKEYWGTGSFLGLYPVKDKIGIFLGGAVKHIKNKGLLDFRDRVLQLLSSDFNLPRKALKTFDNERNPFFWEFHDCRSEIWHKKNIVLLGDAATGFLPTAGVGASMAMDSAAALVDEITRMDKTHIKYGLRLFTHRQKKRVEKAQKDSRELGKMMFVDSSILTSIRNTMLPFYSLQRMLSDLSKVMEGEV